MVLEERIKELAYFLWERDGRPDGKDQEYYFNARRSLEGLEAVQVDVPAPATAVEPSPRRRSARARKTVSSTASTTSKPSTRKRARKGK